MDAKHFDSLVMVLGTASRRRILRTVGAGLASAVTARLTKGTSRAASCVETGCPGSTRQCRQQDICDAVTGRCGPGGHVPDSTPCDDGDPCTLVATCQHGQCIGSNYVLTCDKGFVCAKDENDQFVCAKRNEVPRPNSG